MFDLERFNLKILNGVEAKEEYQDKSSITFATLEKLDYILMMISIGPW
jgi:hypothetical protein